MPVSPRSPRTGVVIGLLAAVSFGVSAPAAKRLVPHADPELLAALLYLGAAVVLTAAGPSRRRREAALRREDAPMLLAVVLAGGVLAPVLLLTGLLRVSGVTGSLALDLEAPATALLAVFVFGEHLSGRAWFAGALIVAAGAALSVGPGTGRAHVVGVVLIAAACVAWALDNNLTQRLSVRDPVVVVRIKALGAAGTNLAIALARGAAWPSIAVIAGALALGAVSFGASILLDAYALRLLGAAREAALFATAPFAGVVVAVVVFGDPFRLVDGIALAVMAVGTALLVAEGHGHEHVHARTAHDHRHVHDVHHQHPHSPGVPAGEPHSHWHEHQRLVHDHPHVSDAHHRHGHQRRAAGEDT